MIFKKKLPFVSLAQFALKNLWNITTFRFTNLFILRHFTTNIQVKVSKRISLKQRNKVAFSMLGNLTMWLAQISCARNPLKNWYLKIVKR